MIPMNLFSAYDRAMMEASQRRRRAALGKWGRLREDARDVVGLSALFVLVTSATVLPWAVGAWTIVGWAFGKNGGWHG